MMANRPIVDDQVRQLAQQLLKTGFDRLSDRERRVITGVAKRTQISRDANRAFDRVAAGLDYEVNLKAELEIMALHEKLDQIRSQPLAEMLRTQQEQCPLLTQLLALDGSAPAVSGAPAESSDTTDRRA
jgi:hypothetical protein